MQFDFRIGIDADSRTISVDIHTLIVAGWAGRDRVAIDHHIEELAAIGVPRPSDVPLYYRIAHNQLTQSANVQAVGPEGSGEVEALVFAAQGEWYVGIASDHTDRKMETHSVALSKQVCAKPIGCDAWRYADIESHWDDLIIRSWIVEDGERRLYQEGALSSLRTPRNLVEGFLLAGGHSTTLPDGTAMLCGTVGAIGGIRPSGTFEMELHDPHLKRSLRHHYQVDLLPEIA